MQQPNIYIPDIQSLADNHARALQQALIQAAIEMGVYDAKQASDLVLSRSNINVEAVVTGMGIHGLYRWLRDYIARQAIPIWARGQFLDGWLATYSMPRKKAVSAQGVATGTGVAGGWIAKGSMLQSDAGQMYLTSEDAQVNTDGTVSIKLVSMDTGVSGNTVPSIKLSLVTSIAGIDSTFKSNAGIGGGTNEETDAEALYRLVQRLANEPMGGAPHDYARWALKCAGITRAWGVRNPSGPTSAGVMIMADNNPDGLPTAEQIQTVYNYIRDPKRGPPDELFVFAPKLKKVDVTLDLTPDSTDTRDAALLELKDLFFREALPGYAMPHTHLIEAVSIATGEHTHRFVAPELISGGYLTTEPFELLVLGKVSFV